jgi:flagellar biosynthesis/type III secretory pathway protein FliH
MLSYSKVIKNGNSDSIAQFPVTGLDEFSVPRSSIEKPVFATLMNAEPVKSEENGLIPAESELPTKPVLHTTLFVNHVPVLHEKQDQADIHSWNVAEFLKEAPADSEKQTKSGQQFVQKVEDYAYLLDDAKAKADEIIFEADKNAVAMIAQAKVEAEALKQKAFSEGMSTARSEVSQTMHQVERLFQETQLWQEQVMHQSKGRIVEMVLAIGKKLFGNGFELSAELIDHIVSRAINEGSRLGNLRIYLNPDDAKLLVNLWQESELTLNGQQIQIVSSQNISRGGCFIDGQFGIVDGRVEEQIDQIEKSIKLAEVNSEVETEDSQEPEE